MEISFCLPGPSRKPIGGYKIVFEYANRLASLGHQINIIFNYENQYKNYNIPEKLRQKICNSLVKRQPSWFELSRKIKKIGVNSINDNTIPNSDVIVATAFSTANDVANLNYAKGKKLYLIQDFENWKADDSEVINTFKLGMNNIVISKWLKEIVESKGCSCTYIPNGIDFEVFNIDTDMDTRNALSISMLYHESPHKGTKYGIEALNILKEKYPDLKVNLFGTPKRPANLSQWMNYKRNATQLELRKIYNSSSIFLCTSIEEGFGLTGAESMACGCALVSTAYKGVQEYAEHNVNALLSPIKDVSALVENVSKLIDDHSLRMKLASNGNQTVKNLSWENSVRSFREEI